MMRIACSFERVKVNKLRLYKEIYTGRLNARIY